NACSSRAGPATTCSTTSARRCTACCSTTRGCQWTTSPGCWQLTRRSPRRSDSAPMNLPRCTFSMRLTTTALLVSCTLVLSPGNTAAQIERTLKGHANTITCVAFAPDGKSLASGSKDGTAIVWDVAGGGARLKLPGHKDMVVSVAFAPDGKVLASVSH